MIILPETPAHRKMKVFQIDFGEHQEPFLGGPETFVGRIGSRIGVSVDLPPMRYDQAMVWISRGLAAVGQTVRFPFRQPQFTPRQLTDWTAGAAAANTYELPWTRPGTEALPREGQAFSILQGTNRYIHFINDASPDANGSAIFPALRTTLLGTEKIEFVKPYIHGSFNRDQTTEWDIDRALTVGLSFTLREQK